jgi:hypothetical protein
MFFLLLFFFAHPMSDLAYGPFLSVCLIFHLRFAESFGNNACENASLNWYSSMPSRS